MPPSTMVLLPHLEGGCQSSPCLPVSRGCPLMVPHPPFHTHSLARPDRRSVCPRQGSSRRWKTPCGTALSCAASPTSSPRPTQVRPAGRGRGGGRDTPYLLRISKKIRKIPNPPKIAKSKTQRHSWVGVDFGRRGNRSEHATRTRRPSVVSRAVCPPAPRVLHLRSVGGPRNEPLSCGSHAKTPTDGAAFATSSLDYFFAKERLPMAFRVA